MNSHANTLRPGPSRVPVTRLERSFSERVQGWLRMLIAEVLCFTSGFRAK